MVVKLNRVGDYAPAGFESRVILDGSQTEQAKEAYNILFESRVILDGSQTVLILSSLPWEFESRVILDGSQTYVK